MRKVIFAAATILVFTMPNLAILQKEKVLARGTTVLIELGRQDPRSLIQGDYMRLWYDIPDNIRRQIQEVKRDGKVVIILDGSRVATVLRVYEEGEELKENEHLLSYRFRKNQAYLGARSFFFQEGHAKFYSTARYGELKVDDNGNSVLIGLRGQKMEVLGPEGEE